MPLQWVQQLVTMGFPYNLSVAAASNSSTFEEAIELLLSNQISLETSSPTTHSNHQQNPSNAPLSPGTNKPNPNASKKKTKKINPKPSNPEPGLVAIYWVRQDFRIADNPALRAAMDTKLPIIPVFLWAPHEEKQWKRGGASKYFLHQVIAHFANSLKGVGSNLVIRKIDSTSSSLEELEKLCVETQCRSIYYNRQYEPWLLERDRTIRDRMTNLNIAVHEFNSLLLHEPWEYEEELRKTGQWSGIGSVPHFRALLDDMPHPPLPLPPPIKLRAPEKWPEGIQLSNLDLQKMPRRKDGTVIDWAAGIRTEWKMSEDDAINNMQKWMEKEASEFEVLRKRADLNVTSKLSPYIHFGQLSIRTLYHKSLNRGLAPVFIRKMVWREMSYYLMWKFPYMADYGIRPAYRYQKWSTNTEALIAWQKGQTGYPLVDAGMRQLWVTGWMHHYVRHVVASFLIEFLGLDWREGQKWFHDTLVDADVPINSMMWQNGGLSGIDQWNFVMDPVYAARQCDPDGNYVKRWVPELRNIPKQFIHTPWRCSRSAQGSYPERIITELDASRAQKFQWVMECRKEYGDVLAKRGADMLTIVVDEGAHRSITIPLITRAEIRYGRQDSRTDPLIKPVRAGRPGPPSGSAQDVLNEYMSKHRKEKLIAGDPDDDNL